MDKKTRQHNKKISTRKVITDLLNSLAAIKELSEIESNSIDESELISEALSVLIANQDMENCSFFLLNEEGMLINVTGKNVDGEPPADRYTGESLQFKVGQGIIGRAAETGELQICKDCKNDPRFATEDNGAESLLLGSIISVPVFAANKILGVLNISHHKVDYFSDWHLRLLHIYKNMLGQLITNCRLFRKMEDQIDSRTKSLQKALEDVRLLKERYETMSLVDELTGLYNRRYFYAQANIALSTAKRYKQSLCLLVLDLDYFKLVNDRFGHSAGDEVLSSVAQTLQNQVRETDILVRLGGEEFVIVFSNTDYNSGIIFADRIRRSVSSLTWVFNGKTLSITASIGIYCYYQEDSSELNINIDTLLHNADLAMYAAKEKGRNRVAQYTPEIKRSFAQSGSQEPVED